ncbi:MAG: homoserine dehydrogenase [Clostridia bacterium]|nr:homoserine dehydrogenase [Clostridia bacterium]
MIQIALLGFGVVGSGTAEVLTENRTIIEKRLGEAFNIKYILDLREFPNHPLGDRVVHDIAPILADPSVKVVAEMMGGSHPAYEFTKAALEAGKSVVTSNKEVVANFGTELLRVAREHHVSYLFEASVGGGIPIIRPLRDDLAPNRIFSISGILNGTTNFILSKMKNDGADFADALKEAQALGYAEANPAADVEGKDAARKIVILAALAFGVLLSPDEISVEGITKITKEQTEVAEALGCAVKLIGHTERIGDRVLALVSPHLVPAASPIHHVDGVFNGILVDADMLGKTFFYGAGAGKLPTASAVVSDILHAATDATELPTWEKATPDRVADPADRVCRRAFFFKGCERCAEATKAHFGYEKFVLRNGGFAFIGCPMNGKETEKAIRACGKELCWTLPVLD